MTERELVELLTRNFYEDFASVTACLVVENSCVDALYELATARSGVGESMIKPQRDKLLFRAAYTLEAIYFEHHELFETFTERFCDDFALCTNGSAKRHFGKMMSHLLHNYTPQQLQMSAIAEAAAGWIVEPKVRVAVQIHAMEILFSLRDQVDWIPDLIEEIIETLSRDPSPAITVRLRRWRGLRL